MNRICNVKGCNEKYIARGCCRNHYMSLWRHKILEIIQNQDPNKKCSAIGCNKKHMGKGLCRNHYARFRRNGDLIPRRYRSKTGICSVVGCNKKHDSGGYCRNHYLSNRYATNEQHRITMVLRARSRKRRLLLLNDRDKKLRNIMERVRRRDHNKCRWYGCNRLKDVHVHHIFPQSEYPELKYEAKYMICYCGDHHYQWHQARGDKRAYFIKYTNNRLYPKDSFV